MTEWSSVLFNTYINDDLQIRYGLNDLLMKYKVLDLPDLEEALKLYPATMARRKAELEARIVAARQELVALV